MVERALIVPVGAAGAAVEFDGQHPIPRANVVAPLVGWAEQRDCRDPERARDVQRPGVASDENVTGGDRVDHRVQAAAKAFVEAKIAANAIRSVGAGARV